jgi:hypothetical protein
MLLGRPWLKLVKAHHKWGDSTQLAITSREWNYDIKHNKMNQY